MRLLIIRHGQTTNNVLMAEIYGRRDRGEITPEQAEEEWLAKRVDDPPITETVRASCFVPGRRAVVSVDCAPGGGLQGIEEAEQLGVFYSQVFKATGSKVRISKSG